MLMAIALSSKTLARAIVLSPFCHQPVEIPAIPPLQRILQESLPHDEVTRRERVTTLLEKLPAHCDMVKRDLLRASHASRYYRNRYGRGLETQKKQLEKLKDMSDDEVRQWACLFEQCTQLLQSVFIMLSQQRRVIRLAPELRLATRKTTKEEQMAELHETVQRHNSLVADNLKPRATSIHTTYDEDAVVHYPAFQLSFLPSTSGVHREELRASLAKHVTSEFRRCVVQPWVEAAVRQAIVLGCRSTSYLQRQLAMDSTFSLLVVDHSLSDLLDAAIALVPLYSARVQFVRSDAFFTLQQLLPSTVADVCVVPMPVPFWSERSSYRRLVTRDFLSLVHLTLKVRENATDARGFVSFTDAAPLADFMMAQLEESRLIVPWTRKNPAETYARWLPLTDPSCLEFRQQRMGDIVALAASKSGPTSIQAMSLIQSFDYKRRYYPALFSPEE